MSKEKVLLSISMLISGREEMKKSLESLRHFKDAFPCEIILVDTGCNPEQRALAEQCADKIIDFTWCGDFAAARNAGLKEAKGEWFMYLDDDEWFDDPKEIVAFFTSGEYKNYNSASYAVRNYINPDGTMYDDSYPSRMCRREPGTRFIGKIHEFLSTFKAPKKVFADFAHHYGYAYKDDEERRKHGERNIPPLLEMVEQYPFDPRWSGQLAQEYFSNKQYEEALQASKNWLENQRNASDEIVNVPTYVGCIYAFALISLHTMERYEEEEIWLEKAFADPLTKPDFMEPTVAFFYLVGARLYGRTKNYEKCREYMSRYMNSYRRLKDDRRAVESGAELIVSSVFQENLLYGTVLTVMGALIRTEDFRLAEEAFFALDWEDKRLLNQIDTERDIVDAVSAVPMNPLWIKILQTLVSRENGMKEMLVAFLDAEIAYKTNGEQEKLARLRRIAAQLDYEHSYILCARIFWAEQDPEISSREERAARIEELFRRLFEKYPHEILEIRTEVWRVAEKEGISLGRLLLEVDYLTWKHSVEAWFTEATLMEIRKWDARIGSWGVGQDIRGELFGIKLQEGYLYYYQEAGYGLKELEQQLWKYADAVLGLYGPCYREEVFSRIPETLPEDVQLALRLKKLQEYREQGDDLKALEAVRKCLGLYPLLSGTMEYYATLFRDDVQRREREAQAARKDLHRVLESLKAAVKQKLEQEDYRGAREILLEMRKCAPEDQELEVLLVQAEKNLG